VVTTNTETGIAFAYTLPHLKQKLMKKLMTLVLVALMAFGTQVATAADYNGDKDKGKKKGKPSFVDEKHRAHAEWKREKEYEKARKKQYKKNDDDRWDDRKGDGRWERREDDRRQDRRERERWEEREQRRNRSLGDILRGGNEEPVRRGPENSRRN
jgi:hypothetical protein